MKDISTELLQNKFWKISNSNLVTTVGIGKFQEIKIKYIRIDLSQLKPIILNERFITNIYQIINILQFGSSKNNRNEK